MTTLPLGTSSDMVLQGLPGGTFPAVSPSLAEFERRIP
jgi:hypothetical protein